MPQHSRCFYSVLAASLVAVSAAHNVAAQDAAPASAAMPAVTGGEVKCADGKAKIFDCRNVDLLSFLPAEAIGGTTPLPYSSELTVILNTLWGWTDSTTRRDFVLVGLVDGLAFVEVTDPADPKYLGKLPLHAGAQPSFFRDVKVYKNYAFIVADEAGPHGMQVFDLTQLLHAKGPATTFQETAHYDQFDRAHTLAVNPETGFLYASATDKPCGSGLHMIDVRTPAKPAFAGCYSTAGYTHEATCAVYRGLDQRYKGREVCVNAEWTRIEIVDVTDKKAPKSIGTATYPNVSFAHQGWFSEDQQYFYFGDEGDEGGEEYTRTIVFDLKKLDDPVVAKEFFGTTHAIDHNLYVRGHYVFEANYKAGLRVLDITDPVNPKEVAYFDTTPGGENDAHFGGTWANYPYFKTAKEGVVALSSISEGLFLVRFHPPASGR